jgi:hypothetical protein
VVLSFNAVRIERWGCSASRRLVFPLLDEPQPATVTSTTTSQLKAAQDGNRMRLTYARCAVEGEIRAPDAGQGKPACTELIANR